MARNRTNGKPEKRPLILVVDDDADTRYVVVRALEEAGMRTHAVPSGAAALQALLKGPTPSAVVTDLLMPGIDGFVLRAEMLQRTQLAEIPVVVMSSYWRRPREVLDVAAVVAKPVDLDELVAAVRGAVTGAQMELAGRPAPSTAPAD
jgi:CheY-like chemotaxis protein